MGDGSVRQTDTSAVATLMDFDFPSSSSDGADYSGSHLLYQDVVVPTPAVAMETLTIAHEGFLLI